MDDKTLKTAKTISIFYRTVTVRKQKGYFGKSVEIEIDGNLTERAAEKRLAEMNARLHSVFFAKARFDLTTEKGRKACVSFALDGPSIELSNYVLRSVFGERRK